MDFSHVCYVFVNYRSMLYTEVLAPVWPRPNRNSQRNSYVINTSKPLRAMRLQQPCSLSLILTVTKLNFPYIFYPFSIVFQCTAVHFVSYVNSVSLLYITLCKFRLLWTPRATIHCEDYCLKLFNL